VNLNSKSAAGSKPAPISGTPAAASGCPRNSIFFEQQMTANNDAERALLIADNETTMAIDVLFIVAQHDGCKWAHECRFVKDLCRATRVETGLWSAMTRVGYGLRKRTLLMYESHRGQLERVQWLLARGAPRDARGDVGRTALIWASWKDHTDIVRALIAGGADVNIANNYGWMPLHYASRYGRTEIVRALIAGGAGVNIESIGGATPLHAASYHGHTDIVLALREAGGVRQILQWNLVEESPRLVHFGSIVGSI
jgi:hypothetical protein